MHSVNQSAPKELGKCTMKGSHLKDMVKHGQNCQIQIIIFPSWIHDVI